MAVVYKITRDDGLEYIGITIRLKDRIRDHEKSLRFSVNKISSVEILYEGEYSECENLEEFFIEKYNTYQAGLNCTRRGKGRSECDRFNTKGFVFSEESRKKMSISAKNRTDRKRGYKHSLEVRLHWSKLRKGRVFCKKKLDDAVVCEAYRAFLLTKECIARYCKKTQIDMVTSESLDGLVGRGGRPLTRRNIFCREYAFQTGGVTHAGIDVCLKRHGL